MKEFDKLSKYKHLKIEIASMSHLNITVLPVVEGALGMVIKLTDIYYENPSKHKRLC